MHFLLGFGLVVLIAGLTDGCTPDNPYNQNATFIGSAGGKSFYTSLANEGLSYDSAKKYCEFFRFKPVIINNAEEDNVIRDYLLHLQQLQSPPEPNSRPFWLSLNDIKTEGDFRWFGSKCKPKYFNWAPGSPFENNRINNCVSPQLLALSIEGQYGYGWINLPCETCWRPLCSHDHSG